GSVTGHSSFLRAEGNSTSPLVRLHVHLLLVRHAHCRLPNLQSAWNIWAVPRAFRVQSDHANPRHCAADSPTPRGLAKPALYLEGIDLRGSSYGGSSGSCPAAGDQGLRAPDVVDRVVHRLFWSRFERAARGLLAARTGCARCGIGTVQGLRLSVTP